MAREMRDLLPFMTMFFMVGVTSKTCVDHRCTAEFNDISLNVPLLQHNREPCSVFNVTMRSANALLQITGLSNHVGNCLCEDALG